MAPRHTTYLCYNCQRNGGEGWYGGPADQYLDSLYVKIDSDKEHYKSICMHPKNTPIEER
jgi:hypothetical protein